MKRYINFFIKQITYQNHSVKDIKGITPNPTKIKQHKRDLLVAITFLKPEQCPHNTIQIT
jgi:hypothetical protein